MALITASIYGDPRLFDLQKQIQAKAMNERPEWKSPMSKQMRKAIRFDDGSDSQGDVIHLIILEFLEGYDPVGPSIHTFKLAMLNRKMMTIIKYIYGV